MEYWSEGMMEYWKKFRYSIISNSIYAYENR